MSRRRTLLANSNLKLIDLSPFYIVNRFSTINKSNQGNTYNKISRIQVLTGSNFEDINVNVLRDFNYNSKLTDNRNIRISDFFNTYLTQTLSFFRIYDEVTNQPTTGYIGNQLSPTIKSANTLLYNTLNGRPCIEPQSQNFTRPEGLTTFNNYYQPALDDGNDYSITIMGAANSVQSKNWVFCSQYDTSNPSATTKILVGINNTPTKEGAIIKTQDGNFSLNFINQITDENLHVVTLTVNGTSKLSKLYLDGVFQDSITYTGTYTNNSISIFSVGGNGKTTNGRYFQGKFQELNISNVELSANLVDDLQKVISAA